MKKKRFIPSDVDVKTDLHKLKLLLEKKNICCSSILRLKERYTNVLSKARKNKVLTAASIDDVAFKIIEKHNLKNFFLKGLQPVKTIRTTGDGNCLYNAISLSLHGDEALNLVLRLLTSIEMFLNYEKYLEIFRSMADDFKESFKNEVEFLTMFLHFSVTEKVTIDTEKLDIFASEAMVNTKPGTFSSMACIYGLSNVIECQINSVYSPGNSKLFPLYTRVVGSKTVEENSTIQLLWSNTKTDYTKPNHFVFCTTDTNYLTSLTSITALSQSIKIDAMECRKRTTQSTINFAVPNKKSKPSQVTATSTEIQNQKSTRLINQPFKSTSQSSQSTSQSPRLTSQSPRSTSQSSQSTSQSSQSISQSSQSTSQSLQSTSQSSQLTSQASQSTSQSSQSTSQSSQSTNQSFTNKPTNQTVRNYPVKPAIECHPNDIGLIISQLDKMTDNEKIQYIHSVWKPPPAFSFPFHTEFRRRWRFSNNYLNSNSPKYVNWLAYSAYHDGVYCLPCVLFGKKDQTKLKMLFTEPLTRWNAMAAKFRDHQTKSPIHKMSVGVMHSLLNQNSNEQQPIDVILNKQVSKQIAQNREKLVPIIKTVLFCARQNIALRGHRDDVKYLNDKTNNPGNFQELLKFRIDSGDKILESHLKNCPKNASYRSKTIQNEIIVSAGNLVLRKIADEIKEARFFSIIADEASDTSNTEQMALVVRFVDQNSEVREEFVDFLACDSTGAEYLVKKISDAVESISLDMKNLRGQAYDGAGNMAGAKSGVSTRIRLLYPKALYFHCASHRLNLAVASSINIRGVKNMMDSIRKCSEIFHFSPKKTHVIQEQIQKLMPEDMRTTLLDVCKTRWLRRIDGLERVHEMMEPILETLDMIATNYDGSYNKDARSDAQGVYWTFKSFQFVVHLIIVRYVMSYTLPLTYELQAKKLDVVKVYKAVDNVLESLRNCRKAVDSWHEEWYKEAVEFAAKFDVSPSIKRIAGQQTFRPNYNVDNPNEYYKLSLTIPLLERVTAELETRFSKGNRVHSDGFFILPTTVVETDDWKTKVRGFAKGYQQDLPEPMNLETEMEQWGVYWKRSFESDHNIPDTIVATLQSVDAVKTWFPNMYRILCLIAVVPASSNSCERSISRLRLLKTYLRSRMNQDRLTSLAHIYIHREIDLGPEEVVDEFAKNHQHRMKFVDILKDD